jgi:hypothetical protein
VLLIQNRDWQPVCRRWFVDYRSKPASSKLVAEKLLNQLNSKKTNKEAKISNYTILQSNLVFKGQIGQKTITI